MFKQNISLTDEQKIGNLKTIHKKKIYEEIVEQVKSLIEKGTFEVGDKLPNERELALKFGVSRNSVREAIKVLEQQSIIKSIPGSGTFITAPNSQTVFEFLAQSILKEKYKLLDVFELRRMIEPKIAYLATVHASKEDIEKLKHNIINQQTHINDEIKFNQLDKEFHLFLSELTNNSVLPVLMKSLNEITSFAREEIIHDERYAVISFKGHLDLFKAIKNRNADLASRKMDDHLNLIEKAILKADEKK